MSRDKLRNELLSKKESALDDLENSLPNQTTCSGNRAKGVAGQSFACDSWIQSTISEARNRDMVIQKDLEPLVRRSGSPRMT